VDEITEGLVCVLSVVEVTAQSEYSTDILFRKRADLEELMPRLCQYSARYFSASDVMSFLGRKLTGHVQGEVVTDPCAEMLSSRRIRERRFQTRPRGPRGRPFCR
jgi:type IV secretory pathway ATPase VirB11/archaellum biosynthesis ATPase